MKVEYVKGEYDKKSTKPPTRFTSSTLLAGMKDIHKYVKDVEVKKKLNFMVLAQKLQERLLSKI